MSSLQPAGSENPAQAGQVQHGGISSRLKLGGSPVMSPREARDRHDRQWLVRALPTLSRVVPPTLVFWCLTQAVNNGSASLTALYSHQCQFILPARCARVGIGRRTMNSVGRSTLGATPSGPGIDPRGQVLQEERGSKRSEGQVLQSNIVSSTRRFCPPYESGICGPALQTQISSQFCPLFRFFSDQTEIA